MAAVGTNEFGARLAPALAALAIVATTAWLGAVLLSFEVGLVAALLLAASPAVFALARYAILDTVFTAFLFGGVSLLAVAALKDRPHLQWPGYVLIALSVLTKGPLSFVLCGLTFGLAVLVSSDLRRRLLALHFVIGLVIVVAVSAPWFVYMWLRFRDAFVAGLSAGRKHQPLRDEPLQHALRSGLLHPRACRRTPSVDGTPHRPACGRRARRCATSVTRFSRDAALVLDCRDHRFLHGITVQARSLRLSGGAGIVSPDCSRLGRRAPAHGSIPGAASHASDSTRSVRS